MSKAGGGTSAMGTAGAFSLASAVDHAGCLRSGGCSMMIEALATHA